MSFNIDYVAGSVRGTQAGGISGNGLHFLRQRSHQKDARTHMQFHGSASSLGRGDQHENPKIRPQRPLIVHCHKISSFYTVQKSLNF
jgi:hypothetical protein